jgi:dipeptidyl aminopeptidase/acylaminoacyl peptidase
MPVFVAYRCNCLSLLNYELHLVMKKLSQRTLAGIAGLAGLAWLSFTAAVAASQRKLIFDPVRVREVEHPRSTAHRTRPIVLRSTDGTRLSGWLLSPRSPGPHPTVLYFGGRSEEVSWVARDAARMFPDMTVLAINYRGYGDSLGMPGETQMIADADMLYDWLAARKHADPSQIAVVGRSLGSGVAIQIAVHRPVAALVLLTPYDSLVALARRRFRSVPVGWVMRHRFESVKYAPRLTAPTLIVRAASDNVVPGSHTDLLVAQLTNAPEDATIPDSDHSNIVYLEQTQQRIARFLTAKFTRVPVAQAQSAAQVVDSNAGLTA